MRPGDTAPVGSTRTQPRSGAQTSAQAHAHFGPSADALCAWLLQWEQSRYAPDSASTTHLAALRRQLRTLRWP